ncbi:MAG: cytochrome c [Gammaproteobacteria bacterium]
MRRAILAFLVVACGLLWWLSAPQGLPAAPAHEPDLANGERLFNAGGCASCHGTLVDGEPDRERLGGGLELETPVGVFRAPNISPHDRDGIGAWSELEFLNAMLRGVAPSGRHYYPAFPYTSYTRMEPGDVLDLKAWIDQLPPVEGRVAGHELRFPFSVNRGLGLWKRLYLDPGPVATLAADADPAVQRGRYLVEGPGHCGECHTPRNFASAPVTARWLAGAPSMTDEGKVPNLTPAADALGEWSAGDIAYYLESGIDPEFDVVGGEMVEVQENMARLPAEDRAAIAAYLKALPRRD